ncbi:MAG TPA: LytR C-terminal domain-containing protein [Candidatus Eisenbacteria bacterium]|jgi:hypothetical protein
MARPAGRTTRIVLSLLAVVVAALVVSWGWTLFGPGNPAARRTGRHVVRVQVLNGSGEPGVGTRVAAWLREGGFQVTDVRNADRNDYFATFVVARRSDLSLAREVAHYLGGPPLVRQEWSSELADVSVLVGSDRSRLQMDH